MISARQMVGGEVLDTRIGASTVVSCRLAQETVHASPFADSRIGALGWRWIQGGGEVSGGA